MTPPRANAVLIFIRAFGVLMAVALFAPATAQTAGQVPGTGTAGTAATPQGLPSPTAGADGVLLAPRAPQTAADTTAGTGAPNQTRPGAGRLTVLSGEHSGFSRLVVVLPPGTDWRFGRNADGYELRLGNEAAAFDTGRVFNLIPRRRITDVIPGDTSGSLDIAVAANTFATAFQSGNAVVIDVADGRAPADSPAERPIDPLRANAAGGLGNAVLPLYRADRPPATDPWIDAIWTAGEAERAREAAKSAQSAPTKQDLAALRATEDALVQQLARAASQGLITTKAEGEVQAAKQGAKPEGVKPQDGVPAQPASAAPGTAPSSEAPPTKGESAAPDAGKAPVEQAKGQVDAPADEAGRTPPSAAPDAAAPPQPGPEATGAEGSDHPFSEAAAGTAPQGTGTPANEAAHAIAPGEMTPEAPVQAEAAPDAGIAAAAEALASSASAHIGIRARTSEDRDSIKTPAPAPKTTTGSLCPDPDALDVATWSGEGAPDLQIATARTAIVGEFDKPDEKAAVSLARLYLTFGLGAEARDVLDAFSVSDEAAPWLRPLADVMEDKIPTDPQLGALAVCPGQLAMWGALALPPSDRTKWNAGTVLRALSGLPPRLRTLLAPPLAERLLARGDVKGARAAMDTIARLPEAPGPAASLMLARISMAEQKVVPALDEISGVIASNDPAAPEAVVLAIQGRLAQGDPVDPALIDTAAALAFEHRSDPLGAELGSAHVAALAASGRFTEAFAALATHQDDSPGADFAPAVRQMFKYLANTAPDDQLVAIYDAHRDALRGADPDPELRRALAERLATLGFSDETTALLSAGGIGGATNLSTPSDRMTIARAALADMRPDRAIDALAGIGGPIASDMRDQAIAMQDGLPPAQGGSASGSGADAGAGVAAMADATTTEAGAASATTPQGPLTRSKALVDESKALRERLNSLLAADPAAANGGQAAPAGTTPTGSAAPAASGAANNQGKAGG